MPLDVPTGSPVDPDEGIELTVLVRRRGGAEIDADAVGSAPPLARSPVDVEAFDDEFGAGPEELERVARFAADASLSVRERSVAECTVDLTGRAEDVMRAFGVELD